MKSRHYYDEIHLSSPRTAGFHRVAISSTAGGFLMPKADLVEKDATQTIDKKILFDFSELKIINPKLITKFIELL